jgi:hypothetical protein
VVDIALPTACGAAQWHVGIGSSMLFPKRWGLLRIFVPWTAAVAIVGAGMLSRLNRRRCLPILSVVASVPTLAFAQRFFAVQAWALDARAQSAALDLAAGPVQGGCPTYLSRFPQPRGLGLARLLRFGRPGDAYACRRGSAKAFVLDWGLDGAMGPKLPAGCASQWIMTVKRHGLTLFSCDRFRPRRGVPDQDHWYDDDGLLRLVPPQTYVQPSSLIAVGGNR